MDLQLTSIRADLTRDFVVHGMHVNGHKEPVTLIVRWAGCDEYQDALANLAFQKLEGAARDKARDKLIATLLIVGWKNVPDGLGYTPARGEQVIAQFDADKRQDRKARLLAFISDGDNFQRPALVDAADLGNG